MRVEKHAWRGCGTTIYGNVIPRGASKGLSVLILGAAVALLEVGGTQVALVTDDVQQLSITSFPRAMLTLRRHAPLAVLFAAVLLVGGCSSLSNTEKGAVIGAGAGAAGGAAVGKAAGGTAEGAILGAVIGGTAGAIIGNRMDTKAEELDEELANAEVERVGEGIKVTFDSGILFDFDSARLRDEARQNLREFAASMKDFEDTRILVVGHTDSKGPSDYNMDLSDRRAGSAEELLVSEGLAAGRIQAVGRGETEPVASNETEEGRQQNRRVEVAIYANEELRERAERRAQNNETRR
jgi:Outer membrane protein and related peptidoglycan-associated (lipo)proteins